MTKTELIEAVSNISGIKEDLVSLIIDITTDVIKDKCQEGESVKIKEFGVFSLKVTKERNCSNPRTREIIRLPGKRTLKFKPSIKIKL